MGTPWRILIVDDDPSVHKLISRMLAAPRYEVASVTEATDAYEAIRRGRPHLVILDLMMPKVSGIEICEKVKKDPELAQTLVLILSAKESQEDRVRGLEIGADDYISKPFHLASLVRKIDYMLTKNVEATSP